MAPRAKKDPNGTPTQDGVWVTYGPSPDWSNVTVFRSEIAAYRHAIRNSQEVIRVPFGSSIADAVSYPTTTKTGETP